MSVSSILAFVIAGAAAFKGKRDRPEERPNRTRYSELVIENGELKARIAELEDAIATANVNARRDQELIDIWRERALANVPAMVPTIFGPPVAQAAAQLQAQAALQQAAAQLQAQQARAAQYQQQQAMNAQQGLAQSLLGAQSLINAELWCNCVPARHDMFLRGE